MQTSQSTGFAWSRTSLSFVIRHHFFLFLNIYDYIMVIVLLQEVEHYHLNLLPLPDYNLKFTAVFIGKSEYHDCLG